MASPVRIYSLVEDDDKEALKADIEDAYKLQGPQRPRRESLPPEIEAAGEADTGGIQPGELIKLPPFDDLIGIDPTYTAKLKRRSTRASNVVSTVLPARVRRRSLPRIVARI